MIWPHVAVSARTQAANSRSVLPPVVTPSAASAWLLVLLARQPRKLAAVALADKITRIAWAMMVHGEAYRGPTPATA